MLGERIREIRKSNQLNQTEFSMRIGVSQGTLSELKQNKYNPSLETILASIKEFDVNALWFLFGESAINETFEHLNEIEKSLIRGFRDLRI
ncbi:DNA-binding transcriptional regulator, XRE-family HTH domain [Paenibacillus algorifonticola]|uniref:DNA-binding transcriptional regulator, XRE-family HTH domain n=1 Tax=Paenibacillus algorifonticola TaxID=684063 RepID=A0A1I2FFG2_9BACL|nr:helix-turn-helix transcriptional regulator [Paenibacillus algorifonticola]SFF04132.1 DNA-binding transcriptional regulator, XRE-family HTH domain [Paenibacillus algorifonticola]